MVLDLERDLDRDLLLCFFFFLSRSLFLSRSRVEAEVDEDESGRVAAGGSALLREGSGGGYSESTWVTGSAGTVDTSG